MASHFTTSCFNFPEKNNSSIDIEIVKSTSIRYRFYHAVMKVSCHTEARAHASKYVTRLDKLFRCNIECSYGANKKFLYNFSFHVKCYIDNI